MLRKINPYHVTLPLPRIFVNSMLENSIPGGRLVWPFVTNFSFVGVTFIICCPTFINYFYFEITQLFIYSVYYNTFEIVLMLVSGVHLKNVSSNVNEVIRTILNLFIFFLYKKISHAQKAQKAYKRIKTKKTAFLCVEKTSKRKKVTCLAVCAFYTFCAFYSFCTLCSFCVL